jgi:hypothetical protein
MSLAFVTTFALAAALGLSGGDTTADQLKELRAAYKSKDSDTAVRLFDQLAQGFGAIEAKRQDEVVRVVESAFASRTDEGADVEKLFVGAAAALANMGASGEKALVRALSDKHLKSKPQVFATLVEGLGNQDDVAMVEPLLTYLTPEKQLTVNSVVVAGAARALGRYREAEPKVRKHAVEKMVAVYADLDAKYRAEHAKPAPNAELETSFQLIETPMLGSLRSLTGQKFENATDWSKWWATAKDVDWAADGAQPAKPEGKKS